MSGSLEQVTCALCAKDRTQLWMTAGDAEYGGSEQFALVRCRDCGLIYLNPRPSLAQIGRHYPAGYYTHVAMSDAAARRAYGDAMRLVKEYGRPGPLFDVGAGDGAFLAQLRGAGWADVAGLEPDAGAQRVATGVRHLQVMHGVFPSDAPRGQEFATVTMLEVIEHLHDPAGALAIVRDMLCPGGRLVLTTPNVQGLEPSLLRRRAISLQVPRHLYFFDRNSLSALLLQAGLRPLSLRSGGSLSGFTRSLWLAARRIGAGDEAPAGSTYRPMSWRRRVHQGLDVGLAPVAWAARTVGRGATLLAVAERPVAE